MYRHSTNTLVTSLSKRRQAATSYLVSRSKWKRNTLSRLAACSARIPNGSTRLWNTESLRTIKASRFMSREAISLNTLKMKPQKSYWIPMIQSSREAIVVMSIKVRQTRAPPHSSGSTRSVDRVTTSFLSRKMQKTAALATTSFIKANFPRWLSIMSRVTNPKIYTIAARTM